MQGVQQSGKVRKIPGAPFTNLLLTLIPAWISNNIHYEKWDEITYPFLNFNTYTVEVLEWINNFTPHFTGACDYLSMLELMLNHVSKRGHREFWFWVREKSNLDTRQGKVRDFFIGYKLWCKNEKTYCPARVFSCEVFQLWDVFCEYLWENSQCYNTAL